MPQSKVFTYSSSDIYHAKLNHKCIYETAEQWRNATIDQMGWKGKEEVTIISISDIGMFNKKNKASLEMKVKSKEKLDAKPIEEPKKEDLEEYIFVEDDFSICSIL